MTAADVMADAMSEARLVAELRFERLPPSVLGKNGRDRVVNVVHPSGRRFYKSDRAEAFKALKTEAYYELRQQCGTQPRQYDRLTMRIHWRQAGTVPDHDQVIARCSAVMDAAEAAGLVADDRDVSIATPVVERVAHKHEQECVVRFCYAREVTA